MMEMGLQQTAVYVMDSITVIIKWDNIAGDTALKYWKLNEIRVLLHQRLTCFKLAQQQIGPYQSDNTENGSKSTTSADIMLRLWTDSHVHIFFQIGIIIKFNMSFKISIV